MSTKDGAAPDSRVAQLQKRMIDNLDYAKANGHLGVLMTREDIEAAIAALAAPSVGLKSAKTMPTCDELVEHMVRRFLQWRLPENFTPDAGISFKRTFNENTTHPMKHEPIGTNLFDYTQTKEMVRYMLHGFSTPPELELLSAAIDESADLSAELLRVKSLMHQLVRAVQNEVSKGTIVLCNDANWLLDDCEKASAALATPSPSSPIAEPPSVGATPQDSEQMAELSQAITENRSAAMRVVKEFDKLLVALSTPQAQPEPTKRCLLCGSNVCRGDCQFMDDVKPLAAPQAALTLPQNVRAIVPADIPNRMRELVKDVTDCQLRLRIEAEIAFLETSMEMRATQAETPAPQCQYCHTGDADHEICIEAKRRAEVAQKEAEPRPCEPNDLYNFTCNLGTVGCPFWHLAGRYTVAAQPSSAPAAETLREAAQLDPRKLAERFHDIVNDELRQASTRGIVTLHTDDNMMQHGIVRRILAALTPESAPRDLREQILLEKVLAEIEALKPTANAVKENSGHLSYLLQAIRAAKRNVLCQLEVNLNLIAGGK